MYNISASWLDYLRQKYSDNSKQQYKEDNLPITTYLLMDGYTVIGNEIILHEKSYKVKDVEETDNT